MFLESLAHLVSKYEFVYTSDPPARSNDESIVIQNVVYLADTSLMVARLWMLR